MTDGTKTASVGVVIALSLLVVAIGILAVGREEGFFRDRVTFVTDFPNVDGLGIGAPVRLIGVQVGIVEAIRLPEEMGKPEVDVVFSVDRVYSHRIRVGSKASLKNLTYLSGEKYVEITPGDGKQPEIEPGGYIESPPGEVEKLIAESKNIATNIAAISEQFRELLDYITEGDTFLARLIKDPEFGKTEAAALREGLDHMNRIMSRVEEGDGLVWRLMTDEEFARSTLNRLSETLDRLDTVAERVEKGQGFLGQLLAEDSELARAQQDIVEVVASARHLLGRIESGESLVGRLLADEEFGRLMATRLDAISADLAEIVRKIDEGEGTIGKLLNEPELYNEAAAVVGGISDSRFLSWVAERVHNKDIKKRIKEYARELEAAERAGAAAPPPGANP